MQCRRLQSATLILKPPLNPSNAILISGLCRYDEYIMIVEIVSRQWWTEQLSRHAHDIYAC